VIVIIAGVIAILVQAIHCIPIKTLPGANPIVQAQIEKGKHCVIDFVRVEFHGISITARRVLVTHIHVSEPRKRHGTIPRGTVGL
jgi:hypothetical protein